MNKISPLNIVLLLAVLVLYILHFTAGDTPAKVVETAPTVSNDSTPNLEETPVLALNDTGSSEIVQASSSKVGYFSLTDLVMKCSYLKLKTENLMKKEERLYQSFANKEEEFKKWYAAKQQELADYNNKKMLVQAHIEQAQREGQEKQQALQMELQKEEKSLMDEKQKFMLERDDIIYKAVKSLNEKAGWDYILVDNPEIRLVVPFNKKNNITDNLADIINKSHK